MAYKIVVRSNAVLEVIEAFDWYENQREGLGVEFLGELENFYSSLNRNPLVYSYYNKPVRQGKINRFPYLVVFEIIDQNIVVYSVFMTDRDPSKKRTM